MRQLPETETAPLESLALFLDVDGTLLEIAATPDAVRVEPQLRALLSSLHSHTRGAVALISGRTIDKLDELFAPIPLLPAAGMHGFERRGTTGSYHHCPLPEDSVLRIARAGLQNIASRYPGTLVEDKRFALALHWRLVPELESTLLQEMELILARVRPQLQLQPGKMVAELRPATATKGEAVREFLREPPFCGRWPIYIGDDLTDESAFECINNAGGVSIAVNVQRPTTARFSLPNVGAVHTWLASLPEGLPARAATAPAVHHEMTQSIPLRF